MIEVYSQQYDLASPAGTVSFNDAAVDEYILNASACSGLGGAPVRIEYDDAPQAPGGIVFDSQKGMRHIVFRGWLNARSALAARETMMTNLVGVLEGAMTADATLTRTADSAVLTVRYEIEAAFPGLLLKEFVFGLIAANPDWA